jgi:hypothetical protein
MLQECSVLPIESLQGVVRAVDLLQQLGVHGGARHTRKGFQRKREQVRQASESSAQDLLVIDALLESGQVVAGDGVHRAVQLLGHGAQRVKILGGRQISILRTGCHSAQLSLLPEMHLRRSGLGVIIYHGCCDGLWIKLILAAANGLLEAFDGLLTKLG